MPISGRPPKPEGQRVNRVKLAHDWTDYPNVPFEGAPALPSRGAGKWPKATLAWWEAVSRMPHAVDWTPTDWAFAFDAARLHANFQRWGETKYESALRAREKVMGTTANYRANLRIRYTDPAPPATDDDEDVVNFDEYRRSLLAN